MVEIKENLKNKFYDIYKKMGIIDLDEKYENKETTYFARNFLIDILCISDKISVETMVTYSFLEKHKIFENTRILYAKIYLKIHGYQIIEKNIFKDLKSNLTEEDKKTLKELIKNLEKTFAINLIKSDSFVNYNKIHKIGFGLSNYFHYLNTKDKTKYKGIERPLLNEKEDKKEEKEYKNVEDMVNDKEVEDLFQNIEL